MKAGSPFRSIRTSSSRGGEHVVVPWTMRGLGRDGIELEARVTWTFTVRGGAIQRLSMYQEFDDALEAAGLRE
jgi:ketosteroid isomerase-like protein